MRTMKKLGACLFLCALCVVPTARGDAGTTNGYLLISVEKFTYHNSDPNKRPQNVDEKRAFKVLMDQNFMSQFKKLPTPTSSGTQFLCSAGDIVSPVEPGMQFTQWFAPGQDGKVLTWFWAEGSEKVDDNLVSAHNAVATTYVRAPSWQTLDTTEQLSFVNNYDGINISARFDYVDETDASLKDALLAPVRAADYTNLVAGDSQDGMDLKVSCLFQNN
jgi:hypothetical protein